MNDYGNLQINDPAATDGDRERAARLLEHGMGNMATLPHSYAVSQLCALRAQLAPMARELAGLTRKDVRAFCEVFKGDGDTVDAERLADVIREFARTASCRTLIEYGGNAACYAVLASAARANGGAS